MPDAPTSHRNRRLAAAALGRGDTHEARFWAKRALADDQDDARNWFALLAIAHAEAQHDELVDALDELATRKLPGTRQALDDVRSGPLSRLPDRYHRLIDPDRWAPRAASLSTSAPQSQPPARRRDRRPTASSNLRKATTPATESRAKPPTEAHAESTPEPGRAPRPPRVPVPVPPSNGQTDTAGTIALVDDDDLDLVFALEEALAEGNRRETVDALVELITKLLPFVKEVGHSPRKLIGWVNTEFDVHLTVPRALVEEACRVHERRGARWQREDGLLFLQAPRTAPAPPPLPAARAEPVPPPQPQAVLQPQPEAVPQLELLGLRPPPAPETPAEGQTEATVTLDHTASTATLTQHTAATETLIHELPSRSVVDLRKLEPGDTLDRLTLVALAGQGGMGSVWQARDADGRRYAVKTVRTTKRSHREALERELELLQLVNRADYFPTVHQHIRRDDQLFVVMDWVEGETLSDWLTTTRLQNLDGPTFLRIMIQICDRLAYLHSWQGQGILFRDLKPRNILIEPRSLRLRLVDFGISHLGGADQVVMAGTRKYLAPEVSTGTATPRTDVFSLGRVGLFLLLGHEDFDSVSPNTRPPAMFERQLPIGLVAACLELASTDPSKRPADVHLALDRLQHALREREAAADEVDHPCATCRQPLLRESLFCPSCGAPQRKPVGRRAPIHLDITLLAFDEPSRSGRRAADTYEALLQVRAASDLTQLRCLPYIDVQPYEYQRRAATEVLSRMRGRSLIADDVGLGKTIEAGLIIKEQLVRGLARRCLIVAPPGVLLEQLQDEMRSKFHLEFKEYKSNGDGETGRCGPATVARQDLVIVSKALISRSSFKPLLKADWDLLVVDECHHFKNQSTKGWRNLRQIAARARSVLLLSATPFSGKPDELFALYSILEPGWLGRDVNEFRKTYLHGSNRRSGRPRPTKALKIRTQQYTIRRRRRDIGGGIAFPERDAVRVSVPLPDDIRALHDEAIAAFDTLNGSLARIQALQQLSSSFESLVEGATGKALPGPLRRRLTDLGDEHHPKVRKLLDTVLPSLPGDEKLLVFTRYRASQRSLTRLIRAAGIRAQALVDQSPRDRVATVRRFRDDPGLRVLVCGEGAGEGLNLQFCSILVNFDLPWNPMKVEQRIGRIQRIGQPRKRVSVVNLVLANTVEARLLDVLEQKLEIFKLFMGETEQILGEALENRSESFESWVASAVLSSGHLDEARFRELEQELERAAKRVRTREKEGRGLADDFIGTCGPELSPEQTQPTKPALDLSFLDQEAW